MFSAGMTLTNFNSNLVYSDSAFVVLNGASLNGDNTLLALNFAMLTLLLQALYTFCYPGEGVTSSISETQRVNCGGWMGVYK